MNLEIPIPVRDLKTALTGLGKVLGKSHRTLPVLEHIRVERDSAGVVRCHATDLDRFVSYRTDLEPGTPGALLIPREPLARLLKGAENSAVFTLVGNQNDVRVRYPLGAGLAEQSFPALSPDEWPPLPGITAEAIALDEHFKSALKQALACASEDASRYVLNGACLDVSGDDGHYLVGTNGHHLYAANSFVVPFRQSLIVPTAKFLTWSGFTDDGDWSLAFEPPSKTKPAWIRLASPHWTFLTKPVEGEYPKWRQTVPLPSRTFTTIRLSAPASEELLRLVPRMPGHEEMNQPVELVVRENEVWLRGRGQGQEQITEVLVSGATGIGGNVSVVLNRVYLLKALRFGFAEFEVHDAESPVLFRSGGRQMVVCPVRLAPPAPATPAPAPDPNSPPETAAEATPSAPQQDNPTESERKETMPPTATMPAPPERGNLKPAPPLNGNGRTETKPAAFEQAIEQVEQVRSHLRDVLGELNDTLTLLKAAEKEKKSSEKEVESVRSTLRSLQRVQL